MKIEDLVKKRLEELFESDWKYVRSFVEESSSIIGMLIKSCPNFLAFSELLTRQNAGWKGLPVVRNGQEVLQLRVYDLKDHPRAITVYSTDFLSAVDIFLAYWNQKFGIGERQTEPDLSNIEVNSKGGDA